MDISVQVLKEPRGFIRVIEILMAIFAFSTTAGFSSSVSFKHNDCVTEYSFKYPFRFVDNELELDDCNNNHDDGAPTTTEVDVSTRLPYNFASSAEFFVATGVIAFLYAGFSLSLYVFGHQTYKESRILPVVDLLLSAVIAVFWLAGSSAWAEDVRNMKYFMESENLIPLILQCRIDDNCSEVSEGRYATLNVSLILGFFNFVLWTSGLWFIFKETVFHQPAQTTEMPKQQTLGPRTGGHV